MVAVGFERADPCPARLKAETTTRNLWPTSRAPSRYAARLAPRTLTQDLPVPLQDCHAYRNAVGRFDHRPRRAESVCPVTAAPAIFGAARLWGARVLPAREVPAKSTRARRSTALIEPDRFIE